VTSIVVRVKRSWSYTFKANYRHASVSLRRLRVMLLHHPLDETSRKNSLIPSFLFFSGFRLLTMLSYALIFPESNVEAQ